MCNVSIAKIDEEPENEELSCFDAHIRRQRMSSFFLQCFLQHVTNCKNGQSAVSSTDWVVNTTNKLCKLRDTSGSLVLYFVYECVVRNFYSTFSSLSLWTSPGTRMYYWPRLKLWLTFGPRTTVFIYVPVYFMVSYNVYVICFCSRVSDGVF